jgi:hypothetical protein
MMHENPEARRKRSCQLIDWITGARATDRLKQWRAVGVEKPGRRCNIGSQSKVNRAAEFEMGSDGRYQELARNIYRSSLAIFCDGSSSAVVYRHRDGSHRFLSYLHMSWHGRNDHELA